MSQKRLAELLDNKERTLDEANELIGIMVGYLVQHGAAILDIRAKMAEHKNEIELLGGIVTPRQRPGKKTLIGFEPPKLKVN